MTDKAQPRGGIAAYDAKRRKYRREQIENIEQNFEWAMRNCNLVHVAMTTAKHEGLSPELALKFVVTCLAKYIIHVRKTIVDISEQQMHEPATFCLCCGKQVLDCKCEDSE